MRYPYNIDKKIASIIHSNNHYIITTDVQGNITSTNEAFQRRCQILGESMLDINFDALVNTDDFVQFKQGIRECTHGQSNTVSLQYKSLQGSNQSSRVIYELSLIRDKKGSILGVLQIGKESGLTVIHNGTERPKQKKLSIEEGYRSEWFRDIANQMPDMMWLADEAHHIIFVNKAWLNFTGNELDDELGVGWLQAVHPEDLEAVMEERKAAFQKQIFYAITFRFRKRDGSYRWLTIKGNPLYNQLGEFLGYTGTCLDTTPVKEAQLQIKRQQELMENTKIEFGKFTKIAQKISSIVILTNPDNQVTWVNDAFVKVTGYSMREVVGKQPGSFLRGPETNKETLQKIKRVIEQGRGIRTEVLYYTKSGSKLWLDIMIETIYDKDGNVTGYITIQKDITLKKVSEKEVQEQMAHLKKISFITSHELRHEFSKILQLIQTAKFQDNTVYSYSQIFAEVEKSANLMNDAIYKLNDQINFASSSSISLNKYLLNQAIEEICLVDDDHLVNKLNGLIIKNVMPSLPVHSFDDIDDALKYIKENPNLKRKIFLDLNFAGRSGWDFLKEYEKMGQPWPVIILTSSIDHNDYERSKKYSNVTHFITKPLTIEQFEKLSDLEVAYSHAE
ncbi:MAG: PAS domain S-box protein [Chitinophagaceae bacterium]|jgi:PAS domain S-box-containing protein|nr:PAS domain S-box protein [Chitinophagaceae bacterium]MCA6447637.1 PAS domain S-box protein [Chitinophagaceae bacterium]